MGVLVRDNFPLVLCKAYSVYLPKQAVARLQWIL
jgi:hypothetical protein